MHGKISPTIGSSSRARCQACHSPTPPKHCKHPSTRLVMNWAYRLYHVHGCKSWPRKSRASFSTRRRYIVMHIETTRELLCNASSCVNACAPPDPSSLPSDEKGTAVLF